MAEVIQKKKLGTIPVFFTAISTILGAVLFLRFGFAVGTLGFFGTLILIVIGHLVTVPTALALSELATSKRVEGGGEYFVISRSFGLNIGSTIGITLFLSQAISVAFYIIAFTEAFTFLFDFWANIFGFNLPRQFISIPSMAGLALIIFKKGSGLGLKLLYIINAILFVALLLFFLGSSDSAETTTAFSNTLNNFGLKNFDNFFVVFAIIFPAFTGVTAGVGLSGDLKNPGRSIPLGTIIATLLGLFVYVIVAYKLASCASIEDLLNNQLVMGKIAIGGSVIIPIGLAACTFSSALGSVLVAPRTLQALAKDKIFPSKKINDFFVKERAKDGEPMNATLFTCILAFVFVCMGDINAVAKVISMFFLLTYGSLCLISFLHHFGSSPSYRPVFKSRWWLSLIGFLASIWVMFRISIGFSVAALIVLVGLYLYINFYHKDRRGFESIFTNTISQIIRSLRLFFQKQTDKRLSADWRPNIICVSEKFFHRINSIRLLNWISYKYGFSTFLHEVNGKYTNDNITEAKLQKQQIIGEMDEKSSVFIDTIISESRERALIQAVQMPNFSGMETNAVLLDFEKNSDAEISQVLNEFNLIKDGKFDVLFLATSKKIVTFKGGIHIWVDTFDEKNLNLMVMLSFIISTHPDWKRSNIKMHVVCKPDTHLNFIDNFMELINSGRLPIMKQNIEFIKESENKKYSEIISEHSRTAGLTLIGINDDLINDFGKDLFMNYEELGDVLFVYANNVIKIE